MQSKVMVIPAGKPISGTLPDGGKGMAFQPVCLYRRQRARPTRHPRWVNDQGLRAGLFYFPGFAEYAGVTDENSAEPSPRRNSSSGPSPISPRRRGAGRSRNRHRADASSRLGSAQGIVAGAHFFLQDRAASRSSSSRSTERSGCTTRRSAS